MVYTPTESLGVLQDTRSRLSPEFQATAFAVALALIWGVMGADALNDKWTGKFI